LTPLNLKNGSRMRPWGSWEHRNGCAQQAMAVSSKVEANDLMKSGVFTPLAFFKKLPMLILACFVSPILGSTVNQGPSGYILGSAVLGGKSTSARSPNGVTVGTCWSSPSGRPCSEPQEEIPPNDSAPTKQLTNCRARLKLS